MCHKEILESAVCNYTIVYLHLYSNT
eukprot:COSAG05_NODE_524_length_8999_cov_4.187528_1_plen_25_part_10